MAQPIERAHLEQLGSRFGGAFVIQLIDLFITQGADRITAAEIAAKAGDGRGVSSAAHALKSSAGNLGARELNTRAADVERDCATQEDVAALATSVDLLRAAFEDACAALRSIRTSFAESGGSR